MVRDTMAARAALMLAVMTVGGCTGGGLFGPRPAPAPETPPVIVVAGLVVDPEDGTALLPTVASLSADRSRQGVIVRAEGIAPIQGFHTPDLRPVGLGADGVEVLEIRAMPPLKPVPSGATATRIVSVGRFYTNREMREIRSFRVMAGQNSLTTSPAPAPPPTIPPPVPAI